MLSWLDGGENRKNAPNENFGRELLELFTLGADGGYTEADVKAAARAFTGWHWDEEKQKAVFDPEQHDDGSGFDTHANQPDTHARLMDTLATALAAFLQDLNLQGRDQDVVVMTYSEFGRRAKENGSSGTDHGAASVLFALGGMVKGGVYGEHPSLEDLDDGDLHFHTDFRSVYATLLERWLGSSSELALGGKFQPLAFI